MRKILALADCNNFFVSCEILKNPALKGLPVCVLSNCDGCVISRSNEAKKIGIPMGMPLFKAKKEFPDAIYLSSDFKLYHQISKRFQAILKDFAPNVEVCSIDEAFLEVTELYKLYNLNGYDELAEFLHKKIKRELGIPVSIGISTSKFLCKLATDKAKKADFYYFLPFEKIKEEIDDYKIEDIWGIGRNTAAFLRAYGIFTAGDILKKDKSFFEYFMGKRGLELKFGLEGENVLPVITEEHKPKSIQKTASFPKVTNNKKFLEKSVLNHLHNACRKMRRYNLSATELTVMLRTKDFRIITASSVINPCTSSEFILNKMAVSLLNKIYSEYILFRSSGVYVSGLKDSEYMQKDFFFNNERFEKLSAITDKLEQKYGKNCLKIGV
ncbi:MAG: hypothetical protein K6C94_05955 [Candidatus Gastranaerophilales bacterium]|nr:hypothetical protein [Candidatus Gastranaerophilales bacterium]